MATWALSHPNSGAPERPGDSAIAALAARQHGVVARFQLIDLGLTPRAIQYRLQVERLHRLRVGVYAVGHAAVGPKGRVIAAVLAYGPNAVASHHDAAWLWGLRPPGTSHFHVTVPERTRHPGEGIRLHRVRRLDERDRTRVDGIPVTTVARTLLDLAEVLRPRQLERVVEDAERLRIFDLIEVQELCDRSPGRRGVRPLRAVLADGVEPAPTKSELERRFLDFCRDNELPLPSVNAVLLGFEVDAVWPEHRLVVELDGYGYHRSRSAFERDRARDAALQVAGFRVVRLTDRRLRTAARAVAQELRALLEAQDPWPGVVRRAPKLRFS